MFMKCFCIKLLCCPTEILSHLLKNMTLFKLEMLTLFWEKSPEIELIKNVLLECNLNTEVWMLYLQYIVLASCQGQGCLELHPSLYSRPKTSLMLRVRCRNNMHSFDCPVSAFSPFCVYHLKLSQDQFLALSFPTLFHSPGVKTDEVDVRCTIGTCLKFYLHLGPLLACLDWTVRDDFFFFSVLLFA